MVVYDRAELARRLLGPLTRPSTTFSRIVVEARCLQPGRAKRGFVRG